VIEHLPRLRAELRLDFVVVNGENAAGADVLTLGDHAWDQREALTYIQREDRLLRPVNYPDGSGAPGRGAHLYTLPDGRRVGVIQIQGNVFMKQVLDNPFAAADEALDSMPLGTVADAVIVDMHCEATSEKMAMGHHCDGRASLVVGSHTHVPPADTMVLSGGTAYQTDAGMCGDYDSVIGMKKEISLSRFRTQLMTERYQPANGEGTVCGCVVETDDATGLAVKIDQLRVGGRLDEAAN